MDCCLKSWNVLNWNIRGLNEEAKQRAVRAKIEESVCEVFCLQETKMESITPSFMKKLAPKRFNKFAVSPSHGASGGLLVAWNGSAFTGVVIESNRFSITVKFSSVHNGETWKLTTVYGPCQGLPRDDFMLLANNQEIDNDDHWMLVGNFNFYR